MKTKTTYLKTLLLSISLIGIMLVCTGCEHEHILGELTVTQEVTCTEAGIETQKCILPFCDMEKTQTIQPTGHKFNDWTLTKKPTCTETGINEHTCTVCNTTETVVEDALGHSCDMWDIIKNATCTETGLKTGQCTICNYVETIEIPLLNHNYGEWVVAQEATYFENEIKYRTCLICQHKETIEQGQLTISFLNHDLESAQELAQEKGIALEVFCVINDNITSDCKYPKTNVIDQSIDKQNKKFKLTVSTAAISIEQISIDINSAGGVEPEIRIKNNTDKQISYIYITLKFYNRMGNPAYCSIRNAHTRRLKVTGPLNGNQTDTYYWDPIIYNYATAVSQPQTITVIFTDNTQQEIKCTGRYWYTNDFYGGELHD